MDSLKHSKNNACRRCFAFLLAFFLTVPLFAWEIPLISADTEEPVTDIWEWRQLKTQEDFPKAGETCPVIICYKTWEGQWYFLKSSSIKDTAHLHRNGQSSSKAFYTKFMTGYEDYIVGKGLNYADYDDDYNKMREYLSMHLDEFDPIVLTGSQYSEETSNYIEATPVTDCPDIAPETDVFYTLTKPCEWSMYVKDKKQSGSQVVRFRNGKKELDDGIGWWAMAELDIADIGKGDDYVVYTKDVGGDRAYFTKEGWTQVYYYDKGGFDTGLTWDGKRIGAIECNQKAYSNFKIFIGKKTEFTVIENNTVIPRGATFYANNNLVIKDGVTISIEPGGVMTVNGLLQNNGVINNSGTLILNPGATIMQLEPKNSNSGQINCYGDRIPIPVPVPPFYDECSELYGMTLNKLAKEIEDYRRRAQEAPKGYSGISPAYYAELAEKAESIFKYRTENPEYEKNGVYNSGGTYTASGGEGNLLIMEGAALTFYQRLDKNYNALYPDSRLTLYQGSTCVNCGIVVSPSMFALRGGEMINRPTGHVFLGYYFTVNPGANLSLLLENAGTTDASLKGMTYVPAKGRAQFSFYGEGKCHYYDRGITVICGSMNLGYPEYDDGNLPPEYYNR